MRRALYLSLALSLGGAARAHADDDADDDYGRPPPRQHGADAEQIFRGPFHSPRLFAMPVADVVGAFQLSLSGDASLLQEPGILTAAGVAAIGFGDVAQVEYRHTSAVGINHLAAPIPAVGVQLQAPFSERPWVPAVAIAFRLGVPRRESIADQPVDETVTDLYLVTRLRMRGPLSGLTLHTGARVSAAKIVRPDGGDAGTTRRVMVLPTIGLDLKASGSARAVAEVGLAPQFRFDPMIDAKPRVDYGLLGRVGVRWSALPAVVLDASVGYQLEVARSMPADGLDAFVQWDIRVGGEVFVPWGAIACRVAGSFCE